MPTQSNFGKNDNGTIKGTGDVMSKMGFLMETTPGEISDYQDSKEEFKIDDTTKLLIRYIAKSDKYDEIVKLYYSNSLKEMPVAFFEAVENVIKKNS